jgi:hypothetical protein
VPLAASPGGAVAWLAGARLLVIDDARFELDRDASHLAFRDEVLAIYLADGTLRSVDLEGRRVGRLEAEPGALDLAVTPTGSVLLSYPDALVRIGETRERFDEPGGALAVESGGVWVLRGTRARRLRPVRDGYTEVEAFDLPGDARAAAVGPDGALYVVTGDAIFAHGATHALDRPVHAVARAGTRLIGLGADGIVDLSGLVPAPGDGGPQFNLPPCS